MNGQNRQGNTAPSPLWHQVHRLVYCSTTDTSYLLQNIVVVHQCAAAPRIPGCRDSTSDQNLYFHETDQLLLRSRKIFHASFANIEVATPSMHHVYNARAFNQYHVYVP